MKYVVAVSGGVDSVVLLDMLVEEDKHELIVAHFDHGIREDSADDARFVAGLTKKYGLAFESKREELGKEASEELARRRRYEFLESVARKHKAKLVTAHHFDDLIETITINLQRGTGWRGLAVFGNETILRPFVHIRKQKLYDYALTHKLEWAEDSTNTTDTYLRNRLRYQLSRLNQANREKLYEMWKSQTMLKKDIDTEVDHLLEMTDPASRYFFSHVDDASASEVLRGVLAKHNMSLPRPNRWRLLHAIKTAHAGTTLQAGAGVVVEFTKRDFIVKPVR